jgi:hypothetical protein
MANKPLKYYPNVDPSMSEDQNIGKISGTGKETWGWQFPAEQVVEELIAAQVAAVEARTDIRGEAKENLLIHLAGMPRDQMLAVMQKYFSTGPGNELKNAGT